MRKSGILLHISSLPSPYGIGVIGREAYAFIDFLSSAGVGLWAMLPTNPTGFSDSPYQSFSSFALNPYFLSLDSLHDEGLLTEAEYKTVDWGDGCAVDYGALYKNRLTVLKMAYDRAVLLGKTPQIHAFIDENPRIFDYALFMALKNHFGGLSWTEWQDEAIKRREPSAIAHYAELLSSEVMFHAFIQMKLRKAWLDMKAYANSKGIELMGDIPIYTALDSADTWTNPDEFMLDENLQPTMVAGVPPDYFSETGQLWGNPLYRWDRMKKNGYKWWLSRIKNAFELFNTVRIDHFRGFEKFYAVEAGSPDARNGEWLAGPNTALFNRVKAELGDVSIVAEDLGLITPGVKRMLTRCGYPGMKVLQFALDGGKKNPQNPCNCKQNNIIYTGTHDNPTTADWYQTLSDAERVAADALTKRAENESICTAMIRTALASCADTAIIPMQDWLELGSEGRMNSPGAAQGNWQWRMSGNACTDELAQAIRGMNEKYDRSSRIL